MTIGSILLSIALLLVVGLFVARPFLFPASRQGAGDDLNEYEALEAQKEAVLAQIRELDFDHETGKVPEEEYQTLRQEYLAEAARLFKALDALRPAGERAEAAGDIEAAVARLRQKAVTPGDDDIEAAVARRRQQMVNAGDQTTTAPAPTTTAGSVPAKRAGFCPQCGEARDGDDKFCAYCGHAFA